MLWRPVLTAVMGDRTLAKQASSLAVCNGQFLADGRWIAPRAHPADGRLAVLIDGNPWWRARKVARRMRLGDHVPDRRIHQLRPEEIGVDGARWPMEADGIAERAHLPAQFRVRPGGLTLWL